MHKIHYTHFPVTSPLPTSRRRVVEFGKHRTQQTFSRANPLQTCYGKVANLLRTCYGETGVMDFGL